MTIEVPLILLALLFFKHFLIDFVAQTDQMVREKGKYGAEGGLVHSGQHALLTFWIVLLFAPLLAFPLALLDGILHYHIDWAKMNISRGLTPADHKFWVWIGVDQLLHYLTYLIIVAIIVL